jgi:succinoglycan biosynthesis transport protein ExoP
MRTQLAEQSSTLLPQHPRIKEMKAQVADLEKQIRSEGERLARSLENDAKVAGTRLETLRRNLDQLKQQTASVNEQDVQLRALQREAKAQRDLFESYLAKYREATARDSIAAAPADARIISSAVVSNLPYFPKKLPTLLIAAFATFCLAAAFVTTDAVLHARPDHLRESLADIAADAPPSRTEPLPPPASEGSATVEANADAMSRGTAMDRGRPPSDLGPAMGQSDPGTPPVAVSVGPLPAVPSPTIAADEPAPASAIDLVATALKEAGEGGRRVAVIGGSRNIGTTLNAIALARLLAKGARVVLVELDFQSPNIEVISMDPGAPGIAELVRGEVAFNDIITRDCATRLHLVAAGHVGDEADTLIRSAIVAGAIQALAANYDYLVIDAGAPADSALASIATMAPQAILVGNEMAADVLERLADHLRAAGFGAVTILTGAPPRLDHVALTSAA